MKNIFAVLLASAMWVLGLSVAHAQDYPSRPILLIAPFSPGTAVDFVARLIAASLGEQLRTSVVVENRLGAAARGLEVSLGYILQNRLLQGQVRHHAL